MQKDAMNEMVLIDDDLLDRTSEKALRAPRLRMNHNFHTREDEPVNRLLNAMEPGTYLPVHRHTAPPKSESIVVLRGRLAAFVFDDRGRAAQRAVVDPSLGVYGFDIAPGVWHGSLVLEPGTVVFEVKPGPYVPVGAVDLCARGRRRRTMPRRSGASSRGFASKCRRRNEPCKSYYMKRREFLKASLLGAAVAAVAPLDLLGGTKGRPKKEGPN